MAQTHCYRKFVSDIKKRKIIGIVGEIGSGKSTMISLLMSFYDAPSGEY
jgi:ABC-type multidrug transport system fused ATPase/permease subunit